VSYGALPAGRKNVGDQNLAEVVARLEKVEKENRTMKRAGLAIIIAAGCVALMGQARPTPTAVEARSFVLQDAGGAKRAELVLEAGAPGEEPSPVLRFLDGKGADSLSLSPTRLELSGKSDLGPDIIIDDAKGTPRVDLGVEKNLPFVLLNDEKGIIRVDMGLERGEPALVINDDKATPLVGFGLSQGRPSISVNGPDGYRATIGSQPLVGVTGATYWSSAASLFLYNNQGKVIWTAP
jgi:hypothetical protein